MHTVTWLLWLAAACTATTLTPNPLYLSLIMLAAVQVFLAQRSDSPLARSFGLFMRAGAFVFGGYLVWSLITVGGARGATVLLALPALVLPAWLGGVVLGGPITAEALAWGATRGLSIWALMVVFGSFNALIDHHRLLRLAPRSLFHAGLAVSIAVAFVPSLLRAIGEISQAQRARGHRFGGPRSWVALIAPLLASSLEKSVQLAESLDARGYGRTAASDRALARHQIAVIFGVLLIAAALFLWLYYGSDLALVALLVGVAGSLSLGYAMVALGALVRRSSYNRERWRRRDSLVAMASALCVAGLALLRAGGPGSMVYFPFPQLVAPGFDLRVGLALLLLAAPAIARGPQSRPRGRRRPARTTAKPAVMGEPAAAE